MDRGMMGQILGDALLSEALYAFDFDVTTGIVEQDIVDRNGVSYSALLGLTAPFSFDETVGRAFIGELPQRFLVVEGNEPMPTCADLKEAFRQGRHRVRRHVYYPLENSCRRITYHLYRDAESGHLRALTTCMEDTGETEQSRETLLKETGERLSREICAMRNVQEALASGAWSVSYDENGEAVSCGWSDRFRSMLGYRSEELPDRLDALTERIHPEDREQAAEAFFAAKRDRTGSTIFDTEFRIRRADGGYSWFRAAGRHSRRPDGTPCCFDGMFVSMDSKHRALEALIAAVEEAQREREQAVRKNEIISAISRLYYAIWSVDVEKGTYEEIYGDRSIHALSGDSGNAMERLAAGYRVVVPPEHIERVAAFMDIPSLPERMGSRDTISIQYPANDGHWHEGRFIVKNRDAAGRVTQVLYVIRLVSEEKRRELEQRERVEQALALAEQARDEARRENEIISTLSTLYFSTFVIDLEADRYEEISAAEAVHRVTGSTGRVRECLRGMCEVFVAPEDREAMARFFDLSTLPDRMADTDTVELIYRAVNGGWHEARFIAKNRAADGRVTHILYVTRIVSREKQAALEREQLQIAYEAERRASEAKTDFLFNMSHDIRTPMNAIMGYTELIGRSLYDPIQLKHYQEKLTQAGNFLLSLINDVLDMARIESGRMELDESYSVVGDIIGGVYEVFEETIREKQLQIEHRVEIEHPQILCDITKLREIYFNLISNAIKYTPPGGRISSYSHELPCDRAGCIVVETVIEDTGIGMSPEFLPHLFESFSRERTTTAAGIAGTGLGMPIVKRLVELMDGTIAVESEPGRGTRITVTLRHRLASAGARAQAARSTEAADVAVLKGKHILLAEDNELNAEIAITLLEALGITVDHVTDGVLCVDRLERAEPGTYDLILMDIQMPNMDGYKATTVIRQLEDKERAGIPIVAMTANAFDEDRRKAFSVGMDEHIAKPVDVNRLREVLAALLR